MSSSSEYSEVSGGQKAVKSPEKLLFSQTCSLLSQYVKEKGSFGDLTLGMTCKNTNTNTEPNGSSETSSTTMSLFPTKENNVAPNNLTAKDLLSSQPASALNNSNGINSVNKEPKAAQLTIFYAGQVIVFDDFPADKAQELMSIANKTVSENQNSCVYTYTPTQPSLIRASADANAPIVTSVNIVSVTGTNSVHEHPQVSSRPIVCDLPIARKASLHRFLEKRKDRIAAKAPYQKTFSTEAVNKPADSMPWLGLGAKTTQKF